MNRRQHLTLNLLVGSWLGTITPTHLPLDRSMI